MCQLLAAPAEAINLIQKGHRTSLQPSHCSRASASFCSAASFIFNVPCMTSCRVTHRASNRDSRGHADILQLHDDEVPTLLFEIAPQDEPENLTSKELASSSSPGDDIRRRPATAQPVSSSAKPKTMKARRPSTSALQAGPGYLRGARSRPTTAGGLGIYSNRRKYAASFGHL